MHVPAPDGVEPEDCCPGLLLLPILPAGLLPATLCRISFSCCYRIFVQTPPVCELLQKRQKTTMSAGTDTSWSMLQPELRPCCTIADPLHDAGASDGCGAGKPEDAAATAAAGGQGKGRKVVAKIAVLPGELLATSLPYAHVLSPKYKSSRCHHCTRAADPTKGNGKLRRCGGGCKWAHYCTAACQKEAWYACAS